MDRDWLDASSSFLHLLFISMPMLNSSGAIHMHIVKYVPRFGNFWLVLQKLLFNACNTFKSNLLTFYSMIAIQLCGAALIRLLYFCKSAHRMCICNRNRNFSSFGLVCMLPRGQKEQQEKIVRIYYNLKKFSCFVDVEHFIKSSHPFKVFIIRFSLYFPIVEVEIIFFFWVWSSCRKLF